MSRTPNGYVVVVLLFVAFVWGINAPVMKVGLQDMLPLSYNALRMWVALITSWLLLWLSGSHKPFAKQDTKSMLMFSLLGFFVFQLFFTVGVNSTTAGNAALLMAMLPVSVAIINRLFRIEALTRSMAIGIVVSLLGVVLVVLGTGKEIGLSVPHLTGALFMLAAQFAYGYYTVFSKDLLERYSVYQVTAYMITITTVLFSVVAAPELMTTTWTDVPLSAWLSVLYSGTFGICIGNFLWIWGVKQIGSTRTALYNNLPPVFAFIVGYLFLHESIGWLQFAGAVVIFAGLYVTRSKRGITTMADET